MHLSRTAAAASLIVTVGSIALSLVIGTATPAWLATLWYPPYESLTASPLLPVLGGLLLVGLVKSWMFWQIFRGPAPLIGPARQAGTWLRLSLYAYLVWLLIPSFLPDLVETVIGTALWMSAIVLLLVVLTGSGRAFRLVLLLLALVETAGSLAIDLADEPMSRFFPGTAYLATAMVTQVAVFLVMVMVLLAQRRDGRWSRGTLLIGLGTFASGFLVALVNSQTRGSTIESIVEAMDVLHVVWLARTAHELNREPRHKPPLRPPTAVMAAATVCVLMAVGPENHPRLSFTWQDERLPPSDCWAWHGPPRVADTPAHQHVRAYLCSVNKPDREISDQALLSRGRAACTRFADGEPVRARPALLALLCPEVIGRRHPDLLLSSAQLQQRQKEKDDLAREQSRREAQKEDALCRDPWPGLRTRFQATASYYDWDTLPYGIYDPEADTADDSDVIWDKEKIDPLEARGGIALFFTPSQDWATCVTAKALRSAPSPLRRKGWDEVVEADIVSKSGRLVMQKLSASGVRFPNLARNGPGRYRLRLYTRQGEDLILVFPAGRARLIRSSPGR